MRQITSDLYETAAEGSEGGPTTHAYLWTREGRDNVLLYNVGTDAEMDAIEQLGGIGDQYLSHQDEITPMLTAIGERFGAILHVSERERHVVGAERQPDRTFDTRHVDDRGVEIIPTPGHTPGSACFAVSGVDGRYLFVGDTIIRGADGRWFAGYIRGMSDREALLDSLELLAGLRPDVVLSSAFSGDRGAHRLDRPWAEAVGEAIEGLRGR